MTTSPTPPDPGAPSARRQPRQPGERRSGPRHRAAPSQAAPPEAAPSEPVAREPAAGPSADPAVGPAVGPAAARPARAPRSSPSPRSSRTGRSTRATRTARQTRTTSTNRAPNGAGSVSARTLSDGTQVYDVFWSYTDDTGARKRAWQCGFPTAKEAEKHRRAVTATVDTGRYVAPADMSVADYLSEWLEGLRLKPATVAGYRRKIRLQVVPHIGRLPLDQVRPLHLNKMYRQLEARGGARGGPLALSTVREVHSILSSAYSDAVKSGVLFDSPTRRADPPTERECKARRAEMRVWSASQLRSFLEANRGDHYYPIWHVAAATGLRRGEVLGLRWADVDLEHGVVSVRRSLGYADTPLGVPRQLIFGPVKNHGAHVIHLDAQTVSVLARHRLAQDADRLRLGPQWQDQDLVFARGSLWLRAAGEAGGPLDPERISTSFKTATARAEVPAIRLHDLRHTWASLALRAGVHPKVVQERLNHASISITLDIYSHVVSGMDAEAAATVADLFALSDPSAPADGLAGVTALRPRSLRRSATA